VTEAMSGFSVEQAKEIERATLMSTYARAPVVFVKGEGCRLFDSDGRRYLDFVAGIATVALGHCHPEITEAVRLQSSELVHTSNLYFTVPQLLLAQELKALGGGGRAFFASSGAEAVECAIKLVRKYWHLRDPSRRRLVALDNSFHGRTMGALSITGQPSKRTAFEPLVGDVSFISATETVGSLESYLEGAAALFVEVIQGEGGIRPLGEDFAKAVAEACRNTGTLLVVDEVQTGLCRTGAWFGFRNERWKALEPDVFTLGKALGNGFPISACVATEAVAESFVPGDHATTLGGGPVVASVACKVIEIMRRDSLDMNAKALGGTLSSALSSLPGVEEVRGEGLLLGADVSVPAAAVAQAALERGLLVNAVGERTIRLSPPLIVTEKEIEEALQVLADALSASLKYVDSRELL
jgi:acetylornithine/N-succinyldiaminopimelate aminotransferase